MQSRGSAIVELLAHQLTPIATDAASRRNAQIVRPYRRNARWAQSHRTGRTCGLQLGHARDSTRVGRQHHHGREHVTPHLLRAANGCATRSLAHRQTEEPRRGHADNLFRLAVDEQPSVLVDLAPTPNARCQ